MVCVFAWKDVLAVLTAGICEARRQADHAHQPVHHCLLWVLHGRDGALSAVLKDVGLSATQHRCAMKLMQQHPDADLGEALQAIVLLKIGLSLGCVLAIKCTEVYDPPDYYEAGQTVTLLVHHAFSSRFLDFMGECDPTRVCGVQVCLSVDGCDHWLGCLPYSVLHGLVEMHGGGRHFRRHCWPGCRRLRVAGIHQGQLRCRQPHNHRCSPSISYLHVCTYLL